MTVTDLPKSLSCRSLFISDVHLGSIDCKAEKLLALLERVECERLYLVGDIVDMLAMRRRVHWPESHTRVLRCLLKLSRSGTEVIYVPGNHDHRFREFCGSDFGEIRVRRNAIHITADGRRLLVTHGDELDFAVRHSVINRLVGDGAYSVMMWLDRRVNELRRLLGRDYWSLAGWIKANVARAATAIRDYEDAAVRLARERGVDGIVCGHLHYPRVELRDGILYCNDGDWVENCTAIAEDAAGALRLVGGHRLAPATGPTTLPHAA